MEVGLTVTGVGSAAAPPNVFWVDLAAQVDADRANAALRGAGEALDRMRAALLDGGVVREDLATGWINLWPKHAENGATIAGYTATLQLTARTRDLDRAGTLLAEAVAAGGDASRIEGASFEYDDQSALLTGAQEAAWRDAEAKAAHYAALSGRSLGRVVAVSAHPAGVAPVPRMKLLAGSADAVPIEPGTSAVTVHVEVRWEFA
jgi:uncharacterized protein YggE